jgi:hypothetical protein
MLFLFLIAICPMCLRRIWPWQKKVMSTDAVFRVRQLEARKLIGFIILRPYHAVCRPFEGKKKEKP